MDSFWLPIYSILKPFEILKVKDISEVSIKKIPFNIPDDIFHLIRMIKNDKELDSMLQVQIRCVILSPAPKNDIEINTSESQNFILEGYKHEYLKEGYMRLNSQIKRQFTMPKNIKWIG